jgi:hypothetical protein
MVDNGLINLNALARPENAEAMAMVAELSGAPEATDKDLGAARWPLRFIAAGDKAPPP